PSPRHHLTVNRSRTAICAGLALGLLPPSTLPSVHERLLPDAPELFFELATYEEYRYPVHQPFPRVPVSCAFYAAASVEHVFSNAYGEPKVLLTTVHTEFASYFLFPNTLSLQADGTWTRTQVPRTFDGWSHVHQSSDGTRMLLAMTNVPAGSGGVTRFVASPDGGDTWQYVSQIEHYSYWGEVTHFALEDSGKGLAVEAHPEGMDGYEQAGFYLYRTEDWGHSWAPPEYRESFDTSALTGVYAAWQARRDNRQRAERVRTERVRTMPTARTLRLGKVNAFAR
ncbi:MAG: hypothetical protein AAFX85_19240, partial [Pseudomonadota bacterium]